MGMELNWQLEGSHVPYCALEQGTSSPTIALHPGVLHCKMLQSVPFLVLLAIAFCQAEEVQSKSKSCKPHKRSVCGSNSKTYRNHCELHRDACLTGLKIQVAHDGHCQEKKAEQAAASPVVCYVADRNELRHRVIQWLQTEVVPDGWFVKGSNFTDILLKYFKSYADQESNKLLRSLCVDALIELSDENADWKLSFDEFLSCLKPGFNPPEKKCALEDETYDDGSETQVECNRCVCACGNWVCTAMTCTDKTAVVEETGEAGQEMTEEEWSLRVTELNKHQVSLSPEATVGNSGEDEGQHKGGLRGRNEGLKERERERERERESERERDHSSSILDVP
ncbi:unnamed protein product [Coregonus sp. 'balchen']|nr:unnamed protein product [Coregonus sp. 'balchen']